VFENPMPTEVSDEEFQSVTALPGAERYAHFVRQVADLKEVWSLRTLGGWVSMDGDEDDDERAMPVWPHKRYAEVFATGDWTNTMAAPIELAVWIERWLPGMAGDEVQVAVFPVLANKEDNVVVSAEELQRDLKQAIALPG
jgi:Protein of unknown function (DUF2750)